MPYRFCSNVSCRKTTLQCSNGSMGASHSLWVAKGESDRIHCGWGWQGRVSLKRYNKSRIAVRPTPMSAPSALHTPHAVGGTVLGGASA